MREIDGSLFFDPQAPRKVGLLIEAVDGNYMTSREIMEAIWIVLKTKYVFHDFENEIRNKLDS